MALSEKERKQLLGFLIFLGAVAVVGFWMYWRDPTVERAREMRLRIDSLERRVVQARRDLAAGSVEALRQRIKEYEANLQVMRQLVPSGAEVPTLIDDISHRARMRGVEIAEITPLGVRAGSPFSVESYRLAVLGNYDAIGEFLTDVASLRRIMVPFGVTLTRASEQAARTYGDTTGSLVAATFQVRTFVKQRADTTARAAN
jgi:type IV pilus assembly protein PilO